MHKKKDSALFKVRTAIALKLTARNNTFSN